MPVPKSILKGHAIHQIRHDQYSHGDENHTNTLLLVRRQVPFAWHDYIIARLGRM